MDDVGLSLPKVPEHIGRSARQPGTARWLRGRGCGKAQPEIESEPKDIEERIARLNQHLKEVLGAERIAEQDLEERQRRELVETREKERRQEEGLQHITGIAASLGISADQASRFFQRAEELRPSLEKKIQEMEKSRSGTPVEKQRAIQEAIKGEFDKTALETMGEKGLALVAKLAAP